MNQRHPPAAHRHGYTLVEMVVAITVLSTLALAAVPLLQMPLGSYLESRRRSELHAQMDLVRHKLAADLAQALPNSVRVTTLGAVSYLEYLEVRAVGRHRQLGASTGGPYCPTLSTGPSSCIGSHDALSPGCRDSCFMTLGPLHLSQPTLGPVVGSDYLVLGALDAGSAVLGNPYLSGALDLKSRITGYTPRAASNSWQLDIAPHDFPRASPIARFYVVSQAVSYACNPSAGATAGTLTRYWGYPITATQPTLAALSGLSQQALLSNRVANRALNCRFSYVRAAPGRGGWVTLQLALSGTTVTGGTESVESWLSFSVREP